MEYNLENILEAIRKGDEGEVAELLDENPALLESTPRLRYLLDPCLLGDWPLAVAAAHGQLGITRLLVQRGADVTRAGHDGKTALHWAAERGHQEVVAFLLSHGGRSTIKDGRGNTPLMLGSEAGHLGVVRMLVHDIGRQGLAVGLQAATAALHGAARRGRKEVAKFLLSKGAQPNSSGRDGMTPLMEASRKGHLGMVQMLLQHIGDGGLEKRDREGNTALYQAAREGHKKVVGFLLSQGAQINGGSEGETALIGASAAGHLGVVRILLQHTGGQGLDYTDVDGYTALQYAARGGQERVVELLLSKGAKADHRTNERWTPLMEASKTSYLGVVRLLLQHTGGLGLDTKHSSTGRTALHWAAVYSSGDVVRSILVAGADPTIRDNGGRTPHMIADGMGAQGAFQWWDGELDRRQVLYRAMCLHKAYTMQRDQPTSRVPTYLEARAAAGHALPSVEVVSPLPQEKRQEDEDEDEDDEDAGVFGKRRAVRERVDQQGPRVGEEEVAAVVRYVLEALNEELVTELLEGFHCATR